MKNISVADVVALPVAERLRLVEAIWDSIAEVPEQLELSPAQAQELDRRLAEFEKDPTQGSPWEEVRARLERAR
jgi:putative addiction module component (TIGR02574 family)